jgi:hypothetical protein
MVLHTGWHVFSAKFPTIYNKQDAIHVTGSALIGRLVCAWLQLVTGERYRLAFITTHEFL